MKTIVIDGNDISTWSENRVSEAPVVWYSLSDSALANAGKPFFIPEFADTFEAVPVVALRIGRIGKSIAPRFASRYFSEAAAGVHFRAPQLRRQLAEMMLPQDKAISFDRSLILSAPFPIERLEKEGGITMWLNGEHVGTCNLTDMKVAPDRLLAAVSEANTMKMGDLLVPSTPQSTCIAINDVIELRIGQETLLRIEIK